MMKLSAFVSAVGVGVALPAPELTLSEIAAHVNADPTSSWRAHSDGRYDNLSMAESYESLRARCGTILAHDDRYVDTNIGEPSFRGAGAGRLPWRRGPPNLFRLALAGTL